MGFPETLSSPSRSQSVPLPETCLCPWRTQATASYDSSPATPPLSKYPARRWLTRHRGNSPEVRGPGISASGRTMWSADRTRSLSGSVLRGGVHIGRIASTGYSMTVRGGSDEGTAHRWIGALGTRSGLCLSLIHFVSKLRHRFLLETHFQRDPCSHNARVGGLSREESSTGCHDERRGSGEKL